MSGTPSEGDPRLEPGTLRERDIRPVVDKPRGGISNLAIVALAVVLGLGLFSVLNARRQTPGVPAVQDHTSDIALQAPPPLYLPRLPEIPLAQPNQLVTFAPSTIERTRALQPGSNFPPPATYQQAPPVPQLPAAAPRNIGGAALVVDTSQAAATSNAERGTNENNPSAAPGSTNRARAGFLANRSTTVAQGTLIPAVLETAFDSTRPGFARALVQRDIRGFDGTQVLIPRGSRLIGEYAADTAQGQNRAMISWSRLIRPDGVTIAIGSPAADPVGRGGVKADVDNHFLARFAGAILQSTLDIGVNLASRSSGSPTIVALPGSVQSANLIQTPANIRPTLRVAQGTSVSVFVARDLDFTDTDGGR